MNTGRCEYISNNHLSTYLLAILSIYKELCGERRKYGTTTIYKFGFKYHPKIVLQQCIFIFRPMQYLAFWTNKMLFYQYLLLWLVLLHLIWFLAISEAIHRMVMKVLIKAKFNTWDYHILLLSNDTSWIFYKSSFIVKFANFCENHRNLMYAKIM